MNAVVSSGVHRKHSNEYTPNTWEDAEVFENVELHIVSEAKRCLVTKKEVVK